MDTDLMIASGNGDIDVVKALIKSKVNVDAQDNKNNTALIFASRSGHLNVVDALVRAEANLNLKNDDGNTALIYASLGNLDIVNALIDAGADLDLQNNDGDTALIEASSFENVDNVNALIRAGANPNLQNDDGDTALIKASGNGFLGIVNALIDAGSNLDLQNDDNNTALILASAYGYFNIVNALVEAGANINIRNLDNMNALNVAEDEDIVDLLRQDEVNQEIQGGEIDENIDINDEDHNYCFDVISYKHRRRQEMIDVDARNIVIVRNNKLYCYNKNFFNINDDEKIYFQCVQPNNIIENPYYHINIFPGILVPLEDIRMIIDSHRNTFNLFSDNRHFDFTVKRNHFNRGNQCQEGTSMSIYRIEVFNF